MILFKSNYFLVDTEECSERIKPGYLNQSNPYYDKISELFSFIIINLNLMPTFFIEQNSSNEKSSTKKKLKSNEPVAAPKTTSSNVCKTLNELVGKRSLMADTNVENKKKLYDIQISKAKVELETALIEKKVAENKLLSSVSETQQNKYKEEILKLDLELKKNLLQK